MRLLLALLALPFLAGTVSAQSVDEIDLPDPPEGFEWQILPEIKAAFLLPDGWYYLAQEQSGTHAYFLTEQDIATEGAFSTGLSINVVADIPSRASVSAVAYAAAHAAAVSEVPGVEIQHMWDGSQGALHSFGVRYRSLKPDGSAVVIHQVNVGNEETGTLYIIMFEAPEDKWETAWSNGDRIMSFFLLNQGV